MFSHIRYGKGDVQVANIFNGDYKAFNLEIFRSKWVLFPFRRFHVFILHFREKLNAEFFQFVEGL